MRVILASTSPRRREILTALGLPFESVAPPYVEVAEPHEPPQVQAERFALGKARSVLAEHALVLGSDTVVVIDGTMLGKPADADDARRMLRTLQGRTHEVITSVAIVAPDYPDLIWSERAAVTMRRLGDDAIEAYLRTGESMDKAGAYALQGAGAALIERVTGDRFAVIGLPARSVAAALRSRGTVVPADVDALYAGSLDAVRS